MPLPQAVAPLKILPHRSGQGQRLGVWKTYENQYVSLLVEALSVAEAEVGRPIPEGPVSGAKT
jgi:hypothetical protein